VSPRRPKAVRTSNHYPADRLDIVNRPVTLRVSRHLIEALLSPGHSLPLWPSPEGYSLGAEHQAPEPLITNYKEAGYAIANLRAARSTTVKIVATFIDAD